MTEQPFKWKWDQPYFEGIFDNVYELPQNGVFVFGSNEAGRHGAGAAYWAHVNINIPHGMGVGLFINKSGTYKGAHLHEVGAYALPTKSWKLQSLPLSVINFYVSRFKSAARAFPHYTFFVSQIGCGLAGYSPAQIAPLFVDSPANVILDKVFYDVINQTDE